MQSRKTLLLLAVLVCVVGGCKRGFYRRTADRDAYCIVEQKSNGPTWDMHPGFTIEPDSRSRFYDPTCPTDPTLPVPAPQLYEYQMPLLATEEPPPRDLSKSQDGSQSDGQSPANKQESSEQDSEAALQSKPPGDASPFDALEAPESPSDAIVPAPSLDLGRHQPQSLPPPPNRAESQVVLASTAMRAVVSEAQPLAKLSLPPQEEIDTPAANEEGDSEEDTGSTLGRELILPIQPVPEDAWQALPAACLRRMLEFENVRAEYELTFKRPVTESQLDPAQRVNLENILELALINSREYQTRKETLYRTALRLSLQRFNFELRFLRSGNGTAANYVHNRNGGIEVNSLGIPSGVGLTRSLYTAGELTARFANDVLLTFNGAGGYSSSIGSEILVDLSQPLIQRDIRFEPLTQAERDVVYAARDFVQFRKRLFRDLAVQYYNLLLTYRSIAINTQDYFSNLGGFNRAAALYQTERIPRFQVDQFEQNVLRSRGNLINSCNNLEGALDRLKLRIGLPTEMPINLALNELEDLTLSDEATVIREQIRRTRNQVQQHIANDDPFFAIPVAAELSRQLLTLAEIELRLSRIEAAELDDLRLVVALLEAEDKRVRAAENAQVLSSNNSQASELLAAQVFLRNIDVLEATLEAVYQEFKLLEIVSREDAVTVDDANAPETSLPGLRRQWREYVDEFEGLSRAQAELKNEEKTEKLPELIEAEERLLAKAQRLDEVVREQLASYDIVLQDSRDGLVELAKQVVDRSLQSASEQQTGLAQLEVDVDEAMLTALVQRLDLMNQRGEVADAWRQIKYAGDDLRSVLNLRATQSIRTPNGSNNPFDFSFDDSTTRLGLNFDSPLNRRVERNNFRLALINYNVALRNLIEAEDNVKLDIRDDLRAITLDQNQYEIAIASAALAYERVASTRFQLALGQGNVTARDFLEAQQAYTESLSGVAQRHIGYIIDRIQFFLDLEQMQVDPLNFWPDLRNEEYPFIPNTDFARTAPHPYGLLPCGPWYSKCIKRMNHIPPGVATSHRLPDSDE